MIDEIQVQDLALIRQATLRLGEGMTVLTGETGAGKTALLSALKLLMGARASADMVRDGQPELVVAGRFVGSDDDDQMVVSRHVSADGRSRASIDGIMASMRELTDRVACSVDLCGQREHQQLMHAGNHVRLLDAWAAEEVAAPLEAYRKALASAKEAQAALEAVREAGALSAAQVDDARFTLKRIDEVAPGLDEYEDLAHELARAENAEALAQGVHEAHEALAGDGCALDALSHSIAALEAASAYDESLGDLAASLREAGYALEDAASATRDYADEIEFDPHELERMHERLSALQGLLRAYGPRMQDVLDARERAWAIVSSVDDAAARTETAEQACAQAESALQQAAEDLDAARGAAIPRFIEAVHATMARLEMGGARLECLQTRLSRSAWTESGPCSVEFLYRPDAAAQPRPLARIASGGEVSRVMLSIKVALGASDGIDTLVFDEVDAGVGGSAALALAEVLADLSQTHQVIAVTHLAQVAVRAKTHYVVRRATDEIGCASTQLDVVEGAAREEEIARMLSGSVTDASLAHARELLGRG